MINQNTNRKDGSTANHTRQKKSSGCRGGATIRLSSRKFLALRTTNSNSPPEICEKGDEMAETTIDLERLEHEIKIYVDGKRELGGMAMYIEGIQVEFPIVMESKTKAPLDCIQFVVRYDDGTADIYEHKM